MFNHLSVEIERLWLTNTEHIEYELCRTRINTLRRTSIHRISMFKSSKTHTRNAVEYTVMLRLLSYCGVQTSNTCSKEYWIYYCTPMIKANRWLHSCAGFKEDVTNPQTNSFIMVEKWGNDSKAHVSFQNVCPYHP